MNDATPMEPGRLETPMTDDGATLLQLAREAIRTSFAGSQVSIPPDPWLHAPGAVFVTLRQAPDGELRGCVGSIDANLPLAEAVIRAARAAASHDRRFARLTHGELDRIRLEVSVLSPATPLQFTGEVDACRALDRTRPGVILQCGSRRGVFLPKVWDSVESAVEFLAHLKIKAGLPPGFWSADLQLQVFTCEEFAEA
jgi:AmmeMemoRadiSam system protein A